MSFTSLKHRLDVIEQKLDSYGKDFFNKRHKYKNRREYLESKIQYLKNEIEKCKDYINKSISNDPHFLTVPIEPLLNTNTNHDNSIIPDTLSKNTVTSLISMNDVEKQDSNNTISNLNSPNSIIPEKKDTVLLEDMPWTLPENTSHISLKDAEKDDSLSNNISMNTDTQTITTELNTDFNDEKKSIVNDSFN